MPEKNVGSWSETEEMRRSLCKALAIHPDTTWEEAIENACSAGIVRDAEYRHCDRVDERNRVLSSLLRGMARRVGLVRRMGRECAADLRDYDAEIIRLLGTVAAVRALADEWRREAKQWSGLAKTPATTMAATLLSKHADEVLRELDGADSATDTPRGDDEPLHEVQCPNCDATIRARMADAPTPSEDDTPAPTPTDDEAPVLAGAAPATVIETVALTLEQLSEPTMVHGKWILAQMARDLRRVLNDLAAEAGTPAQPDVSVICDDMGGPHGVGGPCVLQPGHPHVDGIGGVWPATDALVTEMVARISAGQRLLAWPELTQDLAFIAMVIESAAGSVSTTPADEPATPRPVYADPDHTRDDCPDRARNTTEEPRDA